MDQPREISRDKLRSKEEIDLDTPRTQNLKFLRSKRLAFFTGEKATRTPRSKNGKQSLLDDKISKDKAIESGIKQKQTPRLCEPQPIKYKQDIAVQEAPCSHSSKLKQETNLEQSDTNKSFVANVDSGIVDDTCVPDIEKLSHVMEKSLNTTAHKDSFTICELPKHNHESESGIQETPRSNVQEKNAVFLLRSFVSDLEGTSLEDPCVSEKHKSKGSAEKSTESTNDQKETPRLSEARQDTHEHDHYTEESPTPYLQKLKKETMFTQPETDRSVMRRSFVSDLDGGLLDDVGIPEAQKLKHVMGWAQKFLKKRECEDDIETSSIVSESDGFAPITGDKRTLNIRKEDTKRLQPSVPHWSQDYTSSPSEVCLSSYLGKNQNTNERAVPFYFCKDNILASEKGALHDIKEKGWKEEANINISRVESDSEDSLVQLGGPNGCGNNRGTTHSLPVDRDNVHIQSIGGAFSVHDKSISRNQTPAQDFNYFWVPLDDSSDDEFESRKSNIKFNTDKHFYGPSSSTLSQNHQHLSYLPCSTPESSSSSITETGNITREEWNTKQKWMTGNMHQYKHKDYPSLYKNSHFFEGKFSESETKKQSENSSFFVEHYLKKNDAKTLAEDFMSPHNFISKSSKSTTNYGDITDRTFIVNNTREGKTGAREFIFDKYTDTDIYSKKEHKYVGPVICTKEPGITGSSPSLRVAVKHHEDISDKECPICSSANHSDSNWCIECGSILVGTTPGTDKSHRNCLTNGIMPGEKLSSRTDSESIESSESSSEEIFRLKKETLDRRKLCWDTDSDVSSNLGSSVIDKYYYCMNKLSRDGKQVSSLSKESTAFPVESYSKSQLEKTALEETRIEKDLTFESEASDCGDEEVHTYGNSEMERFEALHPRSAGSHLEKPLGESKIFQGKSAIGKDLFEI
ncbi:uncharacterized protein LOC144819581 [Lissotriton helveticus]